MTSNASRMLWLHGLSPLHVGVGRGLDYVDLPIMREKISGWPIIPGSAIKGVMRAYHDEMQTPHLDTAFGSGGDEDANAGALVFTDARIACMPIRSFYGTFAWCCSPMVLRRIARDLSACGITAPEISTLADDRCFVTATSSLAESSARNSSVFLEDLDFIAEVSDSAEAWADLLAAQIFGALNEWQEAFKQRFVIVPDSGFDFLAETGTEVNTRVRIDEKSKTVMDGALWTEECLPTESLLVGLVWCEPNLLGRQISHEDLTAIYCQASIQLQVGGNASVGQGQVRCLFSQNAEAQE